MSTTVSRLKSTDSLSQWGEKVNSLISSVEAFIQTGGAFTSTLPTISDFIVYDGSWQNKSLIGEILIDTAYSDPNSFRFKIDPSTITNKSPITAVDADNDFILIYDDTEGSTGPLKKVAPRYISSPGGNSGEVQYNFSGSFIGATGFTFDGNRLSVPTLSVDTNVLYTNEVTNRVGINNNSPSQALDVTGDINASGSLRISGQNVVTTNSLGSGIVNSSLTSLGTVAALSAGTGAFSGGVSAASFSTAGSINSGTLGATGAVTLGSTLSVAGNVNVVGTLGATGAVTFGSTLSVAGNVNVVGTLGATGAVTFGSTLSVTGVPSLSTATGVIRSGPQSNASLIGDFVAVSGATGVSSGLGYIIRANSITLTLPSSRTDGDRISFVPNSNTINNYTIARNGANIMGLAEDLIVDRYAPFYLVWNNTDSSWIIS
jgi:hypothetical protein